MKKLNKKVFIIIFSIISIFLVSSIIIYNVQIYKKDYDSIYRALNFVEDFKNKLNPNQFNNKVIIPEEKNIDNMMIMDYEVYTVKLKNNSIVKIIGHSDTSNNFDVETIASEIINKENNIYIGNLYITKYVYNYKTSDTIVIINTEKINKKLCVVLLESILLLVVVEILIYFISKLITKWITKPAQESFDKQKNFIADASHELKTPLAIIMASADEINCDKKNQKYIDNIKYESERISKLINNLLELSKLENGVLIKNFKEENISKIIEKICLTFEAIAFEQGLKIKTNIDDDIVFSCNKDEIEKLISIILDNAIKHSDKNSKIIVNLLKEKNNIIIEIINTGDPIQPEDEEKIFERFYRADKSRNRDSNRYGLGLAIAKSIVLNHGGNISAFSKNKKTTFKIILKK